MILVSDTSVLIHLERGKLPEAIFALPHEFAVPDLLYDRDGLAKCKVDGSLVSFFKRGLPHFVSTAVSNRIESQPALVKNASIEAAQRWLRSCSAKI